MLKSLFFHFFEDRSTLYSPEQGVTRHNYHQNHQFDTSSTSKFPTTTTLEETATEELYGANVELSRSKARNQGTGLYEVNNSSPTASESELKISASGEERTPQHNVKANNIVSTVTTTAKTRRKTISRQASKGTPAEVTTPPTDGTWNEASEMEMGRLFEAAQKLKGSR